MFNVHPECLGKWSNLTSIFFNWVAQPPTRIALDRTESVWLSFAWLMCSRALKFIKSQHQNQTKLTCLYPLPLRKGMSNSVLINFAVPWEFVWNFMPSTFFAYIILTKITRRQPRADLYRIGNPYQKNWCFPEDKAMVHDVEQFVVRALGWIFLVLLVGAVGPKFPPFTLKGTHPVILIRW